MPNNQPTSTETAREAARAKREAAKLAREAGKLAADIANPPATGAADIKPETVTRQARGLMRDAETVIAQRTHFGTISDRDAAYRLFYGHVARKAGTPESFTLADLRKLTVNPYYAGSNKASDGGALNRAVKAGYFTVTGEKPDLTFHATARALADKHYLDKA